MTTLDLLAVQETAVRIARTAGEIILKMSDEPIKQSVKASPVDIVTEADKEAERVIVEALTAAFPDHHIVGEEGGGMGAPIEDATYRWYVDPIDGTTNYANHIPMYSVSLALTDQALTPLVGVVFNPAMNELFSAVKGCGATLNGKPIRVSETATLEQSVVGSGFPYDKATNPDNNVAEWGRVTVRTRGMRRMGSAALDFCYVAAGRFEAFWEPRLNPWDALGGAICVLEAGGVVTNYQGETPESMYQTGGILASNGRVHHEMIDALNMR
jgi:myo-inositol-1(or 4)-monophosphatase